MKEGKCFFMSVFLCHAHRNRNRQTQSHRQTDTHTHTHSLSLSFSLALTHSHTHTHTHTRSHTSSHTHNTHTHTQHTHTLALCFFVTLGNLQMSTTSLWRMLGRTVVSPQNKSCPRVSRTTTRMRRTRTQEKTMQTMQRKINKSQPKHQDNCVPLCMLVYACLHVCGLWLDTMNGGLLGMHACFFFSFCSTPPSCFGKTSLRFLEHHPVNFQSEHHKPHKTSDVGGEWGEAAGSAHPGGVFAGPPTVAALSADPSPWPDPPHHASIARVRDRD